MITGIRIENETWKANFSGVNRVYSITCFERLPLLNSKSGLSRLLISGHDRRTELSHNGSYKHLYFKMGGRSMTDGDGSGGCFSAAAGQLHHSITL